MPGKDNFSDQGTKNDSLLTDDLVINAASLIHTKHLTFSPLDYRRLPGTETAALLLTAFSGLLSYRASPSASTRTGPKLNLRQKFPRSRAHTTAGSTSSRSAQTPLLTSITGLRLLNCSLPRRISSLPLTFSLILYKQLQLHLPTTPPLSITSALTK